MVVINKNDNGYWTCDLVSAGWGNHNAGPAWPLIRWPKQLGITQEEMIQIYKDFGAEEMKDFVKVYEDFESSPLIKSITDKSKIIFMGFKNINDAKKCKEWLESCIMIMDIGEDKNGKK